MGLRHNKRFYTENGEVKYGVLEDAFEEGLQFIANSTAKGLIDPDYLINDRDKMDNKVMNDRVGFVYSHSTGYVLQ